MSADVHEDLIRDYLAARIGDLPAMILNRAAMETALQQAEKGFFGLSPKGGGPTAPALVCRMLAKRNLRGLELLYDLKLVGKNHQLLSTGVGGFQPSADLIAMNTEMGTLFLGEVKRGQKTEREAITELSAYMHGLQHRFWGMNTSDVVWMPIAEEFRITVAAGFAYQMFWSNAACLPLKAHVKTKAGAVADVALELVNLLPAVPDEFAHPLFAWDCFDGLAYNFAEEPPEPEAFVEFITATASRLGYSGFVILTGPVDGNAMPYPHGVLFGIFNPFKGFLKRLQLKTVKEAEGEKAMRREVSAALWRGHDYDFAKEEQYWHHFNFFAEDKDDADKDRISLEELANSASNRDTWLSKELLPRLKMFAKHVELSTPHVYTLLHNTDHRTYNEQKRVSYFGLMQEAVFERLRYEHHHVQDGVGPVMGDIGAPWSLLASPKFFHEFMSLMNYNHPSQPESYDEDDKVDPENKGK